jgi:hypothetical protein
MKSIKTYDDTSVTRVPVGEITEENQNPKIIKILKE